MRRLLHVHLAHLTARACAPGTIRNANLYLRNFLTWLRSRQVGDVRSVTRDLLEQYQGVLAAHRKRNGELLAVAGQHVRITTIQGFFRWLTRQQHLVANPAADLELPRLSRRLPRAVLTAREAEKILAVPEIGTADGLRDRAMLEVLYSTGMRRSELCQLRLEDLDFARGTVLIREGKGRKDRVIPLGRRAVQWLQRYLEDSRPELLEGQPASEQAVFLSTSGQRLSSGVLGQLVHDYVDQSQIGKSGSCHLFRHAMATLMLEGGADIRYIQHILGHARLSTTEIYTQVNILRLSAVHRQAHPAERNFSPSGRPRCEHCGQILRRRRTTTAIGEVLM